MSDFALILSSCEDVISAEVPHYLERISNILKQAGYSDEFRGLEPAHGVDWLKNNCTKAYELFSEFLDKHGHRSLAEVSTRLNKKNLILFKYIFFMYILV